MTTCACGNCQFFDTRNNPAAKQKDPHSGICRYNPPIPPANGAEALWPVVGAKEWCGHFAATVERFMTAAE